MIPNIQPPPPWTPQGWSPTVLQQNQQSFEAQLPAIVDTLRLANNPAPWYIQQTQLTLAQWQTMFTVPVQIVPNPGPNKTAVIWASWMNVIVKVACTNSPNPRCSYPSDIAVNHHSVGVPLNVVGSHSCLGNNIASPIGFGFTGYLAGVNEPIMMSHTSQAIPGPGVISDFYLTVIYSVFDNPYTP